ncbi:hypothetical protein B8A10_04990 [Staphylococcus aureus]|nr:hypothetical protein B7437_09575 [Staphylococcus aureus]ORN90869.1 hypothetical protein B8A10_04990 [Staphylococcus aureus]
MLYRCPPPTCIACRNWCSNFSMLRPRQLAHYCMLTFCQLLCWGPACIGGIINQYLYLI